MFYDDDAHLNKLDGKTVAIIGYGSQGHAHALNLQDSGVSVVVGLRASSASVAKAESHGLRVVDPADAASEGDLIMMLVPDELHGQVWEAGVKDGVSSGNMLLFGHGFSIHYQQIVPPPDVDVALVAPKGPGHLVRRQFLEGSGVPALVAVQQDASGDALGLALAYAKGIGGTRGGVIETTFKDETETDLFGEQAVLCGGVTELVRAGYETLVDAGYDPRLAYFECMHELKLIVDLMYEKGIAGMRYSISNTAEYGDLTRGKRVIGPESRQAMKDLLGPDPVRGVRPRVDRREPGRPGELQAHARGAGRAPGRGRGARAARPDGLDRHRVPGVAGPATSRRRTVRFQAAAKLPPARAWTSLPSSEAHAPDRAPDSRPDQAGRRTLRLGPVPRAAGPARVPGGARRRADGDLAPPAAGARAGRPGSRRAGRAAVAARRLRAGAGQRRHHRLLGRGHLRPGP